jgi:hypothetical protein
MGIGDGIKRAAENAMEDLAGISRPTDDGHTPEPGSPDEEIRVHSSISEGSNAADDTDGAPGAGRAPQSTPPAEAAGSDSARRDNSRPDNASDSGGPEGGAEEPAEAGDVPRDVPGPAGLPSPEPDSLRADPSEGDQDPSAGMGRG